MLLPDFSPFLFIVCFESGGGGPQMDSVRHNAVEIWQKERKREQTRRYVCFKVVCWI